MSTAFDPVPASLASVAPVLVAVFILVVGNGLATTLVPLRGVMENFSPAEIGAIGSAYFVGMLGGTWLAPGIVRRAGHIRAFAALAAIAASAVLGFAIIVEPAMWMALRCIIGFCFGGLYAIVEGWVNAKATDRNRGSMLGLYNVMNFGGSATGQQFLNIAPAQSFTLFSVSAMSIVLALVPMALTRAEPPPLPVKARLDILGLARRSPIAVMGVICVGLANGSLWSLVPAVIERTGLGTTVLATFMTILILGSAASPVPLGRLSDRMDRRWMIAVICACAVAVEIALVFVSLNPSVWMLYGLALGMGFFVPVIYPLIAAHANDRNIEGGAMHMSSTLLFLYCLGAIVGPTLASFLMARFGDGALFMHNAVVHFVLGLYVLWRISRKAPPRLDAEVQPLGQPLGEVEPQTTALASS
ncbi:MFS transporter [Chelatococcus asaccharovorans]|uniref:Sugar phosphate permease n=1 Tax=Chelatococcus asaccharovorans TaxID=28210 RepID=A0A2V3TVH5_9HYPH|nr:MFS transporter [Chelatococcus asaccharovorans]MBS7702608.1 MFS transporter [Chelatococcus asaccharovorans]PXW52211.1 sugar phosphate permease [Chelatococcus asaccharovorans]